jgi:[acyl-carrier-protein] S-malonyltransferase
MRPAAERLRERLAEMNLRPPALPVVNNVDVAVEDVPERIRDALERQLCNPVRWVEIVTAIASRGVRQIVECGPGGVLAGLNKRITPALKAPDFRTVSVTDAHELRELARESDTGLP